MPLIIDYMQLLVPASGMEIDSENRCSIKRDKSTSIFDKRKVENNAIDYYQSIVSILRVGHGKLFTCSGAIR